MNIRLKRTQLPIRYSKDIIEILVYPEIYSAYMHM